MKELSEKKEIMKPQMSLRAEGRGVVAEIHLMGYIGEENDPMEIEKMLATADEQKCEKVVLKVNSGGGCVFTALSMYDALKASPVPVEAEVHGLAASAATLVCMGASKVLMSKNAMWMVHQPTAGMVGTADEVAKFAEMFIKNRDRVFSIYAEKCGKSAEQVNADHVAAVYYHAEDAVAYGFVDGIIGEEKEESSEEKGAEKAEEAPEEEKAEEAESDEKSTMLGKLVAACKKALAMEDEGEEESEAKAEAEEEEEEEEEKSEEAKEIEALKAEIAGLREQLEAMKKKEGEQEALVNNLVEKRVNAKLAGLGVQAEVLPSASEERETGGNIDREGFLRMGVEARLAAVQNQPELVNLR